MKNILLLATVLALMAFTCTGCAGIFSKSTKPLSRQVTEPMSGSKMPVEKFHSVSVSGPGFGYSKVEETRGYPVQVVSRYHNGALVYTNEVYIYSQTNVWGYRYNTDRVPQTYTAPVPYKSTVYGPQGPRGRKASPR